MHFNNIFEKNMTVTRLLLTVTVVPHAGLIYLHNLRLTGGGGEKIHIWGYMVVAI